MYVFDTDVLSALLRGRLPPTAQERMKKLARARRYTTAITIGELYYGALRSPSAVRWLEHIRELEAEFDCLAFDGEAAHHYGELRAFLERKGRRLDDADLRIAATCRAQDCILVSGNQKHFERVPDLRFENWLR